MLDTAIQRERIKEETSEEPKRDWSAAPVGFWVILYLGAAFWGALAWYLLRG